MDSTNEEKTDLDKKLSILTERQREAYLLYQKSKNYSQVGREMGISPSAVQQHVHHAERRFREYESYNAIQLKNNVMVQISLSRGDLKLALEGLELLEREQAKGVYKVVSSDCTEKVPYKYQRAVDLEKWIRSILYDQQGESEPMKEVE